MDSAIVPYNDEMLLHSERGTLFKMKIESSSCAILSTLKDEWTYASPSAAIDSLFDAVVKVEKETTPAGWVSHRSLTRTKAAKA